VELEQFKAFIVVEIVVQCSELKADIDRQGKYEA